MCVFRKQKCRHQFTLIELLVVIAIIAILAGILMPALSSARERGRSITCVNNLKTLSVAWNMYAQDNDGHMLQIQSFKNAKFANFASSKINWYEYIAATYLLNSAAPESFKEGKSTGADKVLSCPNADPKIRVYSSVDIPICYGMNPGLSVGAYTGYDLTKYTQVSKVGKIVNYATETMVMADTWKYYTLPGKDTLIANGTNSVWILWSWKKANVGVAGAHSGRMNALFLNGAVKTIDRFAYNFNSGGVNMWDITGTNYVAYTGEPEL